VNNLLKLWGWVKLNAALLGIAAAVVLFCSGLSYLQGREDGADKCKAKYEKALSEGNASVVAQLTEINTRNAQLVALWEKQNRLTNAALEGRIEKTYQIVEKIVEKPVEVTGDCSIDYAVVGMLNDAARGSTAGDREPDTE
jgi:arginase family enzyme